LHFDLGGDGDVPLTGEGRILGLEGALHLALTVERAHPVGDALAELVDACFAVFAGARHREDHVDQTGVQNLKSYLKLA
jgi:hypothetical protein